MILVSACLVGINCRYDGKNNIHPELIERLTSGCLLPVCPEQLGGLPTPRIPSEILWGTSREILSAYQIYTKKDWDNQETSLENDIALAGFSDDSLPICSAQVVNQAGKDVTLFFLRGARETARLARRAGVRYAILKARSPSCGCGEIYNGSFTGRLVTGDGITAALLQDMGIKVYTEEQITPELLNELIIALPDTKNCFKD